MQLRVVRPMRRKGVSSSSYFVQRIPADVKARAIGETIRLPVGGTFVSVKITEKTSAVRASLRTSNAAETKERNAVAAAHLERVWSSLRSKARSLTPKETVALAGEVYRRFTNALEDDPGDFTVWRRVREANRSALDGRYRLSAFLIGDDARRDSALEERFGPFADLVLGWKAIRIDAESRTRLLEQVARAMDEAAEKALRNAGGDYRPDQNVSRFPEWKDEPKDARGPDMAEVTVTGLLAAWGKEASAAGKAAEGTLRAYGHSIRNLVKFLGHDDARRVTPENVVAFKDARLKEINPRNGKPVSAKTVNDGDLTALKTVFGWGVRNRKLVTNPATGITVAFAEKVRVRQKGFTNTEALTILRHARGYKPKGAELPKTTAAKQWVPWLCAYTGARLGEMVQLRKEDVRHEGKVWVLRITPEAGTVKGRRYRDVPLHPQLVELGFPASVATAPNGYLFLTPTKKGGWRGPWQAVKNRVSEFVREVVSDPQVQPSHGWRHRFITQAREYGMDQELRRMITGHRGEGVDEVSYGDPAGLYREICKLPRYDIG